MNRIGLFYLVAVVFGLLHIIALFDTYFATTLTTNIPQIPQTGSAPAKRVVVFLADGTKADTFFGYHFDGIKPVTPYFRDIIKNKGSWGVSFTRAPTESRVCSTAVMAGFHEDPHAFTRAWSAFPVPYDHLLNQTAWGWSYGTPDIVDLFQSSGNKPKSVNYTGYSDELERKYEPNPSKLDEWVIETFQEVLDKKAKENETLNKMLRTPQIGIFIHLISADAINHVSKTYSPEYYNTMTNYDQLLNDTVAKIEAFYGDSKTAYIFTADHGLNDAGGHGDGTLNCTRTPFVAWGPGISGPIQEKKKGESHDDYSRPWGHEGLLRRDIHQIDIVSLAASLIGVPIPVNNLGMLPVEYLNVDKKTQSEFLLTNAKQICNIYQTKNKQIKEREPIFFSYQVSVKDVETRISSIEQSIKSGSYEGSLSDSRKLIEDCRSGINYLQKYDWGLLFLIIGLGYSGFAVFGWTTIIRKFSDAKSEESYLTPKKRTLGQLVFIFLSVLLLIFFFLRKAPLQYYVYAIFPICFWFDFLFNGRHVIKNISITMKHLGYFFFFVLCLGLLIWAQYERRALSWIYIVIAICQVIARRNLPKHILALWVVSCLATAIFPSMEPVLSRNAQLYTAGWLLTVVMIVAGTFYWKEKLSWPSIITKTLVLVGFYIATNSDNIRLAGATVPYFNKIIANVITILAVVLPIIFELNSKDHFMLRMLSLFTCMSAVMTLLSMSYELLLFACFTLQLVVWVHMEKTSAQNSGQSFTLTHQKNGVFMVFFIYVALFGINNLATLNFKLWSASRFLTTFPPFSPSGLYLLRMVIPFVILAVAAAALTKHSLKMPSSALVFPTLSFGAVLAFSMFYFMSNIGSWLEIGNGFGRFVIATVLPLIVLGMVTVGHLLMRNTIKQEDSGHTETYKKFSTLEENPDSPSRARDSRELEL